MMIKIIFSDFDNTLIDYYSKDNYFDEYKINVLKKVRDKGIKFCIVTGRSVSFFRQFPNLMDNVDYIMGSNGACIYDVRNDEYLYCDYVNRDSFNEIIGYLLENGCSFTLNCKDMCYRFDDTIYDVNKEFLCDQIVIRIDRDKVDGLLKRLENISDVGINNISFWNKYCSMDVNSNLVSKGRAIVWLCSFLNININDVIAFGDGANDKSMFEVVNKGVAVNNSVDILKVFSKDVTSDCWDNGVYKYIEDNILK